MFRFLSNTAIALVTFFIALSLGILAAILYLIPLLLRAASVLGWLAATFLCITTLRDIYSPFTDEVPMFALQFGVVVMMVHWAMVGLREGKQVWGLLAAGAVTLWGVSEGMTWLSLTWQYADLFFRVLPPALLMVGMLTLSTRARARRLANEERRKRDAIQEIKDERLPGKDYSGDALGYRRTMDQTLAMAMILTAIKTEEGKDTHEQG